MLTRGVSCAAIVALVALSASAGCAFSSYQTAKMLPQGGTRVGAGISNYSYHVDGDSGDSTAFEFTGSHGLMPNFELGAKFGFFSEQDSQFYNLLLSPKLSLIPDVLALTAQTGIMFADADDADNIWLTMPGVIYTYALSDQAELDLTAKLMAQFADDFSENNFAGALNFGFRWTPPGHRFSLFPEIGFAYDDDALDEGGDTGYFIQFGFAFQFDFGPQAAPPPAQQPPMTPVPIATPPPAPAPAPAPLPPPPAPAPEPPAPTTP
jgi:hypothetical protein